MSEQEIKELIESNYVLEKACASLEDSLKEALSLLEMAHHILLDGVGDKDISSFEKGYSALRSKYKETEE